MPSPPPPPPGLALGDIYYVLFRHKWKILILSALGVVAALLIPLIRPVPYQSEAKLLIRYVQDARSPVPVPDNDPKRKSPDERGENIINTEIEILTSFDLALEVVTNLPNIGPEKILAKAGHGSDAQVAAVLVRKNLLLDVPKKSNVIRLVFQHPDSTIVQPVLNKIIDIYLKRHTEIHRAFGDDFFDKKYDELNSSLKQTEEALRKAKTNLNASVEDSRKMLTEQLGKVQQSIIDTESDLAEHQAAVIEMNKLLHPENRPPLSSNHQPTTSSLQSISSNQQPTTSNQQLVTSNQGSTNVPSDKVAEYKRVSSLLDSLTRREQDLLLQFTPENSLVKSIQAQIAENQKVKEKLESDFPGLLGVKPAETRSAEAVAAPAPSPRVDLIAEMSRVASLQEKIRALKEWYERLHKQAAALDLLEGPIASLQRERDIEENRYRYFRDRKEQSQIDSELGAANIGRIQAPSPPFQELTKQRKMQAMALFGCIAAAIALAFLLELYFDRSLKRPIEIERTLGIPLFLSIPRMSLNGNGKPRSLKPAPKVPLLPERSRRRKEAETSSSSSSSSSSSVSSELRSPTSDVGRHPASSIQNPAINSQPSTLNQDSLSTLAAPPSAPVSPAVLRPFFETLRDRLIAYFELKNLTHKPKLVAVTSCGEGAGVTTTAAGLAAALSETGEGNVLLVDMNGQQGAAHHFYKGSLECGLDDALEVDKRDGALVQDNLYVVTESASNGDPLPRVLPKRFKHLVPKLRASDYDYIIFDMPPVSQISATPRLARFMDMVFLVVESEKTDRDVVKRASALLAESKCNLGVILNKNKAYVPKMLQQEL